jgi:hypothetical protein
MASEPAGGRREGAPRRLRWAAFALLALLPASMLLVPATWRAASGPFYLSYRIDPPYAYLMNALRLTCGGAPQHIDHPGTPVQEFGAVVIAATSVASGASPICPADAVIARPEYYLGIIVTALQIIAAVFCFAFPALLFAMTGNLAAALAAQIVIVASQALMRLLDMFMPEVAMIPVLLGFGMAALPLALGTRGERRRDPLVLGGIVGLGLATKLTLAPLLLFVFLLRSLKARILFLACCFCSFIVWTAPIARSYKRFLGWAVGLAVHADRHGEGAVGLPTWAHLAGAAHRLITTYAFELSVAAAGAITGLAILRRAPARARFLLVSFFAVAAQLAITIKHPAPHYMIPAVLVTAIMAGLVAVVLGERKPSYAVAFTAGLALLCIPAIASNVRYFVSELPAAYAQENGHIRAIREQAGRQCGTLVYHDDNSDQLFALRFGNNFAGGAFGAVLQHRHPEFAFYLADGGVFYNFVGPLGRELPPHTGPKPLCSFGTVALPPGGEHDIRLLAQEGPYRLYAMGR